MKSPDYYKTLLLLLALSFLGSQLHAQPGSAADSIDQQKYQSKKQPAPRLLADKNEFSIWTGFALDSYRFWGKTKDAHIQSVGLRYNRKLIRAYNSVLEYNLQVNLYSNYSYQGFEPYTYQNSLSGFGVSPVGLQLNFLSERTFQPFINISTGLMHMDKPFPDNRGKKLNFTFNAGGGVEMFLFPSVSLSLGVRYHHLSNGERGEVNPGIDSNFYYTSITFF